MNHPRSPFPRGAAAVGALVTLVAALAGSIAFEAAGQARHPESRIIGRKVADLPVKDLDARAHSLAEYERGKKALVLVFVGTECPISNNYAEALSHLAATYAPRGVQFLAVNSNREESFQAVAEHAREYRYGFPVVKDETQALANSVQARVTPEAFVLDARRVVRYRGRIDNQYANRLTQRRSITSHDLQAALDSVLAGRPVPVSETEAFGCAILRPEKAGATARVTYHRDVEPILQERCQSCHRPGQVAPFTLLSYADARKWCAEIKQFTGSRQMPPWKAEPGHGDFLASRRLSDTEVRTLSEWVDTGAVEGSAKDAPAPRQWTDGWMLGKPDLVLTMPEAYHVAATGADDFRCFVLPTGLTEDREVTAVEIRPGNPRVVHHVLNFIDLSGKGRELDAKDPLPGYSSGPGGIGFFPSGSMGGWAPGNMPRYLPDGVGRHLPKGSDIVAQIHYHKTGKPETDRTSIGLYFARKPVTKQVRVLPLTNLGINLPPGEAHIPVTASMTVAADAHALTITPHMHLLGNELKVTATFPDGQKQDLVWVKNWDYRWQDSYTYREAVPLPKGTRLDLTAYYDNSTANPLNPNNPPKRVTFGEQTTDEMCFAFIEFTYDTEPASQFHPGRLFGRH